MRYRTARTRASMILSLGLTHCTSEPSRPAATPTPASGELQFPRDPKLELGTRSTASIPSPAPPEPDVESSAVAPDPLRETAPLTDEQIVAVSDLLNTAVIDRAMLARTRANDPRVKRFAEMLVEQHGRAKRDQAKLVAKLGLEPQESERSSVLSAETAGTLTTLKNAKPADFDRLYIASQVTAHRAALETLDKELIANAKNFNLRRLLQNTRQVVASHLEEARKIEQDSSFAAAGTGAKRTQ